jgi:geranylgeranyl diphosphate synthase, type I
MTDLQAPPTAAGSRSALEPTARSAAEVLAWSRVTVDPALRTAVDGLPTAMRLIAGYHFGWWDECGRAAEADRGKAVRPALVLLGAAAVGGSTSVAVPGAVAVELVHNFSLLHDDVMDGDRTRRHRPTAWSVYGVNAAILAGDSLLTLALDVLAATGGPAAGDGLRMLSSAVQDLVAGQSADTEFENRADVQLDECLRMAENKTGALLGCAVALGAHLAGGRPQQVQLLRSFGVRLGLAFQLTDDLLGIWGDPAATGKPVHSDLSSRKKSLPVVAALNSGTEAGRALRGLYRGARELSQDDLVRAATLVEEAGGRDWSRRRLDTLLAEARRHLHAAGPVPHAAAELDALAALAAHRTH